MASDFKIRHYSPFVSYYVITLALAEYFAIEDASDHVYHFVQVVNQDWTHVRVRWLRFLLDTSLQRANIEELSPATFLFLAFGETLVGIERLTNADSVTVKEVERLMLEDKGIASQWTELKQLLSMFAVRDGEVEVCRCRVLKAHLNAAHANLVHPAVYALELNSLNKWQKGTYFSNCTKRS